MRLFENRSVFPVQFDDVVQLMFHEELGISISVGHFLGEHLHDYGEKQVLLKAYQCAYASGELLLVDHDDIQWVLPEDLSQYRFAPADIPLFDAIRTIA